MRKIYIILLFILFYPSLYAQNNEQKLIDEGVVLHDSGEYEKAIEKYRQVLSINPKSQQAIYEMALSYLELKDYKKAIEYSTQIIDADDKNLSMLAYCVKSEALAEMNQVDKAIELLKEAIRKHGDHYLFHFNLALNYYKKNDTGNALSHVKKAIDLNKSNSDAFLLNAYALNDVGLWVQSILSFQMFLLTEPDSQRSKNAFEEMLQTMRIKPASEKPVERSFIQQQLNRNPSAIHPDEIPPLTIEQGLNRNYIYHAITTTLDSLKTHNKEADLYTTFTEVNKAILTVLEKENDGTKEKNAFWTFYVPFFTEILHSNYYETYCRYISVSYFPESLEWWNANKAKAEDFLNWFENGDK
ncbi:MAG TPA: tetratricopeptide repeat protein [Dysgonamonadaceae bacterium]|mgnify:FL=1|jgi:lipopolysaccharide biosynthesis regulator YciM|nr:tetratricopeptide repeat protein [Dysgonamonadaceae bacterium]